MRSPLLPVCIRLLTATPTHWSILVRSGAVDPGRQVPLFRNRVCSLGELAVVEWGRWGFLSHYYAFHNGGALRFFSFSFFAAFPSWSAHSAGIVIRPVSCGRRLLSASPPLSWLPLFPGSNNSFFFLPLYIYVHFLPLCVLFVLFCCLLWFSFPPVVELGNNTHTHNPELVFVQVCVDSDLSQSTCPLSLCFPITDSHSRALQWF